MNAIGFIGSTHQLRAAAKLHGYFITRKLEPTGAYRRAWLHKPKLTLEQLKEIDEWLSRPELSMSMIINLVRIRGYAKVVTETDFNDLLFRSGYAYRYALFSVEKEESEFGKD